MHRASGVTRVGVARGGNSGCHPYFFPEKNWRPFLVTRVCQFCGITPINFLLQKLTTFFAHHCHFLLISLGCHPLEGVTLTFFYLPTSFVHISL